MEGTIYLLDKCNMNCKHCYSNKNDKQLTYKQIEQIKGYSDYLDITKFILLGGEPLLYPLIENVLDLLPKVTIYTNGLLVADKIDILKKAHVVILSIDGYKDTSEKIRGKGTWKKTLDALQLLKKEMPKKFDDKGKKIDNIMLRCSYWSEMMMDIEPLIEEISIPSDIPIIFFPRTDKEPLSAKQQVDFYTYLISMNDTKSFVDQPNFFQYIGQPGRCPAGNYRINFCSDGKITPCNMNFSYTLGHIGDMPEAIQRNIETFLEYDKVTPFECSTCRNSDVCKGGCLVAKTYSNCPMAQHVNLEVVSTQLKIDTSGVQRHYEQIRDILRNVVSC